MRTGWVFALAGLVGSVASASEGPSFDCEKAQEGIEQLVCATPQLAALDREMARLYGLAENGPNMTPERLQELQAYQRGWIKGRDDCWKAVDEAVCVRDDYVMRIADLRQRYFDARQDDDAGVTIGPLALACDGLDAGVMVTYINVDPGLADVHWRENSMVMEAVPVGSGARYATPGYELWGKGDDATFTTPDVEYSCRFEEIG